MTEFQIFIYFLKYKLPKYLHLVGRTSHLCFGYFFCMVNIPTFLQVSLVWQNYQALNHLSHSLLNTFHCAYVPLNLEITDVVWQCRAQRGDHSPWPGHLFLAMQSKVTLAFFGTEIHCWLMPTCYQQIPHVFFTWNPIKLHCPHPVLM